MLRLYIANKNYSSWSLRPWVLMRARGVPFEEKVVPFGLPGPEGAFRTFSPSGRVPCLIDGDTTVWDSLAITEYLAERFAGVWPMDATSRAWARCAAAEMHSGFAALRERCSMSCGVRVRLHDHPPELARDLARLDELWRDGLDRFGGPFLAGAAFTATDAFFCPVAFRVQTYGLSLSPAAMQYADHLLALPAMQEWYAAAVAEPWRDHEHEADAWKFGTVTADLRAGRP
jgi:glutathione S-transferase